MVDWLIDWEGLMPSRRKSVSAKYKVNVSMRAFDIAKAGAAMTLSVRDRSGHLGTMEIGQGSLRWKPPYGQKFRRIPWARLADVLNDF
jgi:hypothetical protein